MPSAKRAWGIEEADGVAGGGGWRWAAAHLEAVKRNELLRPWGAPERTPGEAWSVRQPITAQERAAFAATGERSRADIRRELGYDDAAAIGAADRALIERKSVMRALVAHGSLLIRRRRIPPVLRRFLAASNSYRRTLADRVRPSAGPSAQTHATLYSASRAIACEAEPIGTCPSGPLRLRRRWRPQ